VLGMMVLGVGIVMDRRVRLRRDMVLVMVITLPAALVHRHGRWDMGAGHHCPAGAVVPSQSAPAREPATKL
jgi:hypothetical protein